MSTSTFTRADETDGLEPDSDGGRRWSRLRRSTRRRVTVILAAALVLVLFAVWLVAFSSAFGVRSIQVRGAHDLTSAQIEHQAGIAGGTPLVRIDTAAVTTRVESLSDVYTAEVSTSFPSTVLITVVERTPVGFVRADDGFHLVDRTGDQYRVTAHRPSKLPELVIASGAAARTTSGAVARVAAALPRRFLTHVTSIQALDPQAITLLLTHDRVVQWGTSERSADKAAVLPILLRSKTASQFVVVDPDRPYSN